jgi:hypothetical protein
LPLIFFIKVFQNFKFHSISCHFALLPYLMPSGKGNRPLKRPPGLTNEQWQALALKRQRDRERKAIKRMEAQEEREAAEAEKAAAKAAKAAKSAEKKSRKNPSSVPAVPPPPLPFKALAGNTPAIQKLSAITAKGGKGAVPKGALPAPKQLPKSAEFIEDISSDSEKSEKSEEEEESSSDEDDDDFVSDTAAGEGTSKMKGKPPTAPVGKQHVEAAESLSDVPAERSADPSNSMEVDPNIPSEGMVVEKSGIPSEGIAADIGKEIDALAKGHSSAATPQSSGMPTVHPSVSGISLATFCQKKEVRKQGKTMYEKVRMMFGQKVAPKEIYIPNATVINTFQAPQVENQFRKLLSTGVTRAGAIFGLDTESVCHSSARCGWNTTIPQSPTFCQYNIPCFKSEKNGSFVRLIQISNAYGSTVIFDCLKIYKDAVLHYTKSGQDVPAGFTWYLPQLLIDFLTSDIYIKVVHTKTSEEQALHNTFGLTLDPKSIDIRDACGSNNNGLKYMTSRMFGLVLDKGARKAQNYSDSIWVVLRLQLDIDKRTLEYSAMDSYITVLIYLAILAQTGVPNFEEATKIARGSKPLNGFHEGMWPTVNEKINPSLAVGDNLDDVPRSAVGLFIDYLAFWESLEMLNQANPHNPPLEIEQVNHFIARHYAPGHQIFTTVNATIRMRFLILRIRNIAKQGTVYWPTTPPRWMPEIVANIYGGPGNLPELIVTNVETSTSTDEKQLPESASTLPEYLVPSKVERSSEWDPAEFHPGGKGYDIINYPDFMPSKEELQTLQEKVFGPAIPQEAKFAFEDYQSPLDYEMSEADEQETPASVASTEKFNVSVPERDLGQRVPQPERQNIPEQIPSEGMLPPPPVHEPMDQTIPPPPPMATQAKDVRIAQLQQQNIPIKISRGTGQSIKDIPRSVPANVPQVGIPLQRSVPVNVPQIPSEGMLPLQVIPPPSVQQPVSVLPSPPMNIVRALFPQSIPRPRAISVPSEVRIPFQGIPSPMVAVQIQKMAAATTTAPPIPPQAATIKPPDIRLLYPPPGPSSVKYPAPARIIQGIFKSACFDVPLEWCDPENRQQLQQRIDSALQGSSSAEASNKADEPDPLLLHMHPHCEGWNTKLIPELKGVDYHTNFGTFKFAPVRDVNLPPQRIYFEIPDTYSDEQKQMLANLLGADGETTQEPRTSEIMGDLFFKAMGADVQYEEVFQNPRDDHKLMAIVNQHFSTVKQTINRTKRERSTSAFQKREHSPFGPQVSVIVPAGIDYESEDPKRPRPSQSPQSQFSSHRSRPPSRQVILINEPSPFRKNAAPNPFPRHSTPVQQGASSFRQERGTSSQGSIARKERREDVAQPPKEKKQKASKNLYKPYPRNEDLRGKSQAELRKIMNDREHSRLQRREDAMKGRNPPRQFQKYTTKELDPKGDLASRIQIMSQSLLDWEQLSNPNAHIYGVPYGTLENYCWRICSAESSRMRRDFNYKMNSDDRVLAAEILTRKLYDSVRRRNLIQIPSNEADFE